MIVLIMNCMPQIIRMVVPAIFCSLTAANGGYADEPRLAADDITLVSNLHYREGCRACILDLAMPKKPADKPRPAIVVIHGGGWVEGDKSSFATTKTPGNILDYAKLGFVAVTINYRLSGQAPFPAAIDDCRCAVRWLRAHAAEYHVDPSRIGAWGNSAGGHLALLLGMMPPQAPDKQEPYADQSSQVQAVVSDSGPIDLLTQYEHKQLIGVIEKFMADRPRARERPNSSGPRRSIMFPKKSLRCY
jgi:acetyl esterase/lipase